MKFEKIIVAYWYGKIKECKFSHQAEYPYSVRKQTTIVNYLLKNGWSVMLQPLKIEPTLII